MIKEYLDNPQATAEMIRGQWLYSGDNVRMDEDGYFFFVDRGKDLIKRAGENVSAGEVEAVIREHRVGNSDDRGILYIRTEFPHTAPTSGV
jgi:carnitine-CoA ligase